MATTGRAEALQVHSPQKEIPDPFDTQPHANGEVGSFSRVTPSPTSTPSVPENLAKSSDGLADAGQGNGSLTRTAPDAGPDQMPPPSGLPTADETLKKTLGYGTRLAAKRSNEEAPPIPHGRRASEGGLPAIGTAIDTTSAPRKSVQFTRDAQDAPDTDAETSRSPSIVGDKLEPPSRTQYLFSKLKGLATSQSFTHSRTVSAISSSNRSSDGRDIEAGGPTRSEQDQYFPMTLEEADSGADADADADADAEESATEGGSSQVVSRKRRKRTRVLSQVETAPASPRSPIRPGFLTQQTTAETPHQRPQPQPRRATDTEMSPQARQGISEDEGRRRMDQGSPWRRKGAWSGLSYAGQRKTGEGTSEARRPMTLRNFANITSASQREAHDSSENPKPSRTRAMAERGTTLSAQKWRQLKNNFRLLGQKKQRRTIDHEKSAELLAELGAGGPAVLMLASMFQRDEHGNKRIPVLLEQLKVSITDSEKDPTKDREHLLFRIELEYGSGINRMKWVVRRALNDFVQLHVTYKTKLQYHRVADRKSLPHFPRSAFPFIPKSVWGDDGEDDDPVNDQEGTATDTETGTPYNRRRPSISVGRRKSSTPGPSNVEAALVRPGMIASTTVKRDGYGERQRKKLEVYLQQMIKFLLFRPESNRLCKFLEISALGMRLAAEGSYHGKEGSLVIQSAKGLDFRKALTPANIKGRHGRKWFLVRHSYVVCVDSPEEMHIYDVFLVDEEFQIQARKQGPRERNPRELASTAKALARNPGHHRLKLQNSERQLKLLAESARMVQQFEDSIRDMVLSSPWAKPNRFRSFAPVRPNCFAQWLVDGRDYMWVLSRAINQAKDVIYIHDWWLSPELYLRRPPAISQKWRLDRLLKRKAEEGVKIFVIVYRNIESAVPIDSQYTKFSLLDLHPNIFVQRSPNQFRQNTFFWAHHEKLCLVDHTVAFVGGIDLCFGRWDTPQHTVIDDKSTGFEATHQPKDAEHCQLWPGKDYSNPRVQDFYALNKPYEEMYDRTQVARMPWHDISMQVVGQPARDLTRHFVQRWNYILRQRKPTRPTPFLLPPPDFNPADLEALGLDGTCEVQIVRSAGPWSLGTPDKTEHSIMNAYIKMIEESEHFVYIENQFFISSCQTEGATICNLIGDALVERATRAAKNDEAWKAVIIIPLIPGFQNTVEQEGGTSVRLIMQYQYRSICRGESSIFGRLRAQGIEPEDYIQFYALRQWGKIGPKKMLVTEQLYIHAKCMVVDDRIAIIGSANINERSMLGNRDSECAAVVRDTDMVQSHMNGEPYQVGRFPHTLRMRLMREHLGLDVDEIMEDAQIMETEHRKATASEEAHSPELPHPAFGSPVSAVSTLAGPREGRGPEMRRELLHRQEVLSSFNHDADWEQAGNPNLKTGRKLTEDPRVTGNTAHREDVEGHGLDNMDDVQAAGYGEGRDTTLVPDNREVLVKGIESEGKAPLSSPVKMGEAQRLPSYVVKQEAPNPPIPPRPAVDRMTTAQLGLPMLSQLPALPDLDDSDIGGPAMTRVFSKGSVDTSHPLVSELKRPQVDRNCMQDPLHDAFSFDTWHAIAENNTKIYRTVFRCMPDNEVKGWKEYKEYVAYEERFNHMQGSDKSANRGDNGPVSKSGPPGAGTRAPGAQLRAISELPGDVEKKSGDIKDKVLRAMGESTKRDEADAEKEKLRVWAAEANQAQMTRQDRRLGKQEPFPLMDEKAALPLETVPEDLDPLSTRPNTADEQTAGESPTDRPTSSQSTAVAAEKTPPQQFVGYSEALNANVHATQRRRRRGTTRSSGGPFKASDDIPSVTEAEELLGLVQGHLVVWPYDWLEKVEAGGNWLFPLDQITPIEIYV